MRPVSGSQSRELIAVVFVSAAIIVGFAIAGQAAPPKGFTGAAACGSCHAAAYKVWQSSAHATASTSLGKQKNAAACLACHATGDGISRRFKMDGVQCEACHGAGAAYSPEDIMRNPRLSRALGLRDVKKSLAAVCAPCHGVSTKVQPFSAARAWRKIAH